MTIMITIIPIMTIKITPHNDNDNNNNTNNDNKNNTS